MQQVDWHKFYCDVFHELLRLMVVMSCMCRMSQIREGLEEIGLVKGVDQPEGIISVISFQCSRASRRILVFLRYLV